MHRHTAVSDRIRSHRNTHHSLFILLSEHFSHLFQRWHHHQRPRFLHCIVCIAAKYLSNTQAPSCHFCLEAFTGFLVLGVKFKLFSIRPCLSSFIFNHSPNPYCLCLPPRTNLRGEQCHLSVTGKETERRNSPKVLK